jgi:hypothetical protein
MRDLADNFAALVFCHANPLLVKTMARHSGEPAQELARLRLNRRARGSAPLDGSIFCPRAARASRVERTRKA